MKNKVFIVGLIVLLLVQGVLAIESTSYNATRTQLGLTGSSNASSTSYTLKATTYFQQTSTNASGTTYASIVGFLNVNDTTFVDVCGDGIAGISEECDDGDSDNNNACKNDCTLNVCGDGYLYIGVESCDDGNIIDNDGCSGACHIERDAEIKRDSGGGGSQEPITIIVSGEGNYTITPKEFNLDVRRGQVVMKEIEIRNEGVTKLLFNVSVESKTNENIKVWFDNGDNYIENLGLGIPIGLKGQTKYISTYFEVPSNTIQHNESFDVMFDDGSTQTPLKFNLNVNEPLLDKKILDFWFITLRLKHLIAIMLIFLVIYIILAVVRDNKSNFNKARKKKQNKGEEK
jgi:cysteine-rich repeat protein